MNVAVLAMALAESRGLSPRDVRAFGVAGLLHDIGKVKIPLDVLTKPGRFTDTERALMNGHPAEGARIILRAEEDLDLAAVVAYEHHIMLNGDGYPRCSSGATATRGASSCTCATCTMPSAPTGPTAKRGRSRRPCRTSRIGPARSSIPNWRVRSCG